MFTLLTRVHIVTIRFLGQTGIQTRLSNGANTLYWLNCSKMYCEFSIKSLTLFLWNPLGTKLGCPLGSKSINHFHLNVSRLVTQFFVNILQREQKHTSGICHHCLILPSQITFSSFGCEKNKRISSHSGPQNTFLSEDIADLATRGYDFSDYRSYTNVCWTKNIHAEKKLCPLPLRVHEEK